MASVSGAQTSRTLLDIIPQYPKSKIEIGSVRLKSLVGISTVQCSTSRFPKLEECAHFHYDHVDLQPIQLALIEGDPVKGDFDGITLKVTSGHEAWQIRRSYDHFCKLDQQLHKCVFDRKFSELPVLSKLSPKSDEETRAVLKQYVSRLSWIGSGCAISCGPALSWFELDNRGRRIVAAGQGINTPAVAAAFATTPYTASATDELSFQIGDMISVIDMPPAEESIWWRGKRGFVVGFFPSNCVAVITDKIPNEIALAEPSKPVLRKHGKLIAFFRAFILSRPSRRRLKQSGILKERVFGCDLSEHLLNSGREIPLVLKCCSDFIEAHGIVDGIYRLSGVTSNIQRLRSVFDEDRIPSLTEDSNIKQDIHSVASLLKMYFRELPNPLCTYQLYDEFVSAVQSPPELRIQRMRRTVRKLPPPHYRTLEYLMGHLGRVCGHSSGTGMTARNVAIVWAPNLLRCRSLDQGVAALQGVGVQAVVTEFLILYSPTIFGTNDISDARPKSLAVCSPTKLLTLEEAQARGHSHRLQYTHIGETKDQSSGSEQAPCYHTIIEFPRKRPALNWKTIFTPRRSHQTKSPRRFKRKTVIKSAEYLTVSGISGPSQASNNNTHSRSVSHDSYFDTGTGDPSCSSLIDTQHEGLSLSLDLSELQMNFDVEESEMRIFSEDETNQLFSSGVSLLGSSDNLEQRFSSQELRYIDSYSPEPTDSPSETSPRYQPLLTPSSYENLRVNNGDCGPSSQRTSASYAYEKLAESPILGEGSDNYEADSCKEVKCENDLYEGCYERMELGTEGYEPVSPTYQNQGQQAAQSTDNNIYEDVQELTPSEIYCQVSYLKNSVEELNRFVSGSTNGDDKRDSLSSSEKKDCISIDDDDERVEEEEVGVYQEIINSPEEVEKPIVSGDTSVERSNSLEPLISEEKLAISSNQILRDNCNISAANVPDRGVSDKILESSNGTNYEIVDFVSSKETEQIFDNNKKNKDEIKTPENFSLDDVKCDTKLSVPVCEVLGDKVSSEGREESERKAGDEVGKHDCTKKVEVNKRDWTGEVGKRDWRSEEGSKRDWMGEGGSKRDWIGEWGSKCEEESKRDWMGEGERKHEWMREDGSKHQWRSEDGSKDVWMGEKESKREWMSEEEGSKRDCMDKDKGNKHDWREKDEGSKRDWKSDEGNKLEWTGEEGKRDWMIEECSKREWMSEDGSKHDWTGDESSKREWTGEAGKRDWMAGEEGGQREEEGKTEKVRRLWEGDGSARERIERYKEERRIFFRKKYGAGGEGEEGDDLIRRIKQRTQPRSPTKTTVSISYSPARVPSDLPTSPEKKERLGSP